MPDFPIVDTHLHLWDVRRFHYGWLESVPALNKNHLIEDYRRECGPVQVEKMVFVQCECAPAQALGEAEWVTDVARTDPRIRGIVARASLELGAAAEPEIAQLAALPLVKGVRRLIQSEPDLEFCLQPGFVRGVQLLPRYGLSFDLCIKHPQLANTIELVRQCPDVRFILDHIGKPDIAAHQLEPWKDELRELARLDNVWCKLSGLVTEANHATWTTDDLRPYIEHVIACFGFDRVMFGSDWPVSSLATHLPRWVHTVDTVLAGCSSDERIQLYTKVADAFYRL